jgi:hypothetical protein
MYLCTSFLSLLLFCPPLPIPFFVRVYNNQIWNVVRVTRLGEFPSIGRLFTFGSFLKNTESALIFGPLFTTIKVLRYFGQKLVGQRLGYFLINSSGHPECTCSGSVRTACSSSFCVFRFWMIFKPTIKFA